MSGQTGQAEHPRPVEGGEARRLALGVLLSGFPGTDVPGWLADAIRDGLAGVILFAQNTPDIGTTRRLTDALRACRDASPGGESRISGRKNLSADSRSADGSRIDTIARSSAGSDDAAAPGAAQEGQPQRSRRAAPSAWASSRSSEIAEFAGSIPVTHPIGPGPGPMSSGPPLPLVVAVDEEGGDVTRLQSLEGSMLPGNAALGIVDDVALTRSCGAALGRVLACAGIDLDLAPMLDVSSDPRNPVVGTRSFGADPALVARHGRAFADGLSESVSTCGKHYPGHGATRVDSHLALPLLDVSEEVLRARDGLPFAELIASADPDATAAAVLDAVMTGHLVVPDLGPAAASLSAWATRRLRALGHEGPIVTDALGMAAIADAHGLGEVCVLALEADADLLCLDAPQHRDAEAALAEALDAITAALMAGRLSAQALARSAERTSRLARPVGSEPLGAPGAGLQESERELAVAERTDLALQRLAEVGLEAARRSVWARLEDPQRIERAPSDLTSGTGIALEGPPIIVDVRRRATFAAGRTSTTFERVLLSAQAGGEVVRPADVAELDAMLDVAPIAHEIVVLTGQATSDAAEGELLAAVLAAHPRAVVIHTGVAATAPHGVARLVCAHGNGLANSIAVGELLGVRDPGAAVGIDIPRRLNGADGVNDINDLAEAREDDAREGEGDR